jgi:hypothetical protein
VARLTKPPKGDDSTTWRVGQRVSRKESNGLGTVVEADGKVKVKWDDGKTSYYRRGVPANVQAANTADAADDAMDGMVEEGARPKLSK